MDDTQTSGNVPRHLAMAALAAAAAVCTPPAVAATDLFLKLGDIKGESQDSKHKDEIDVLAWSWGLSQPGQSGAQNAATSRQGRVCLSGLTITKRIDKSTPLLLAAAFANQTVPSATLSLRKAGEGQQDFLTVELSNPVISGFASGGVNTDEGPTESVTLNFSSVTITYIPQSFDGTTTSPVTRTVGGSC